MSLMIRVLFLFKGAAAFSERGLGSTGFGSRELGASGFGCRTWGLGLRISSVWGAK